MVTRVELVPFGDEFFDPPRMASGVLGTPVSWTVILCNACKLWKRRIPNGTYSAVGGRLPDQNKTIRGRIMESDIGIISCMHVMGKAIGRFLKWKRWTEDNCCLSA